MRLTCYCLIGFLGIWGTWTFVSAWLNCIPVAKFWNDSLEGHCLNKKALWFSNSGIHIFTDIVLLVFPMPVLKSLQLPRRQKLALMGVFALGALYVAILTAGSIVTNEFCSVLVTSILRLQSLLVISDSKDSTCESNLAIL